MPKSLKQRPKDQAAIRPQGALLTPGAGAGRDHPQLVNLAATLEALDPPVPTRRTDFPYRAAGRRVPDKPPVAIGHIRDETARWAEELGTTTDHLLIGGRSYGGRMCSMATAEGLAVAALVLISYPLHPPGKPDRLRVDHFGGITVPVLFISGRSDPFGSPAEFDSHLPAIPGPVTVVRLDGGHDLRKQDNAIAQAMVTWLGN